MNTIVIVLPILFILMLQVGLEFDMSRFARVVKSPVPLCLGLIGQLVLLPIVAFVIAMISGLDEIFFLGILLIACSPGGSSSNVFSMLAKGDVELSVMLTATSSIITIFTIPFMMSLGVAYISAQTGSAIELPIGKLLAQNILMMLIPILLGYWFKRARPNAAAKVHKVLGKLAFPALMLLAAVFFIANYRDIIDNFIELGACMSILILVCMGGGWLLSRAGSLARPQQRTIVIEVGMQNAAQAIAVATSPFIFASERMAIPAIIYALMMNIILLTYLQLLRKKA